MSVPVRVAFVKETVRYTYRLRPGADAERALLAGWHRCRFLWNEAVHLQRTGRRPTFWSLSKLLTEARGRFGWLREGSQVAQQQMLRTYARSLNHSFKVKGRGWPKLKSRRKTLPTLEYTTRGFAIRGGRLRLPAGVDIPVVWSRDLPSDPSSVRVCQDSIGYWYASFVVRREVEPAPNVEASIGIDWGVSTTATTTDPAFDLPYLGHRRRCAAELAKAQRKMSRRYAKGKAPSNGYQRAKRELIERGTRAGRTVVLVPPAYTTMTCSNCASINKTRLGLGMGAFRCEACGFEAGRDWNAARTILATAERIRAGVDDVRHLLPPLGDVVDAVRVRNPPASAMGNR
ncbi:MAG: RNA-guided endonuclease InsQ/TnpB family protein [Dermatophilaceae bacterium]